MQCASGEICAILLDGLGIDVNASANLSKVDNLTSISQSELNWTQPIGLRLVSASHFKRMTLIFIQQIVSRIFFVFLVCGKNRHFLTHSQSCHVLFC